MMRNFHVFIGAGGIGQKIVRDAATALYRWSPQHASALLKTGFVDFAAEGNNPAVPVLHLTPQLDVENPGDFIQRRLNDNWAKEFERRWPRINGKPYMPATTISDKTKGGQIRANGRLAFEANADKTRDQIRKFLASVDSLTKNTLPGFGTMVDRALIWVVASTAGGTGAGMLIDLMAMLREESKQYTAKPFFVNALLIDPSVMALRNPGTEIAGHACLAELDHYLSNPTHYDIRGIDGRLIFEPIENRPNAELVFVVSAQNRDGVSFDPSLGIDPYLDLASGWLTGMVKMDASGDRIKDLTENIIPFYSSGIGVAKPPMRAMNYAAPGYARLSFPQEAMTTWTANRAIITVLRELQDAGYPGQQTPPLNGLKDLLPHVKDGLSTVADFLRSKAPKGTNAPFERARSLLSKLATVDDAAKLREALTANRFLDKSQINDWIADCSAAEKSYAVAQTIWLEPFKVELHRRSSPLLDEARFHAVSDLCADLSEVLAQQEKASKDALAVGDKLEPAKDKFVAAVTQALTSKSLVDKLFSRKWKTAMAAVQSSFKLLLDAAEARAVRNSALELFRQADAELGRVKSQAEDGRDIIQGLVDEAAKQVRVYTAGDRVQVDAFRSKASATLEIQVGLIPDLLTQIGDSVVATLTNREGLYRKLILESLKDPNNDWPGMTEAIATLSAAKGGKSRSTVISKARASIAETVKTQALSALREQWGFHQVVRAQIEHELGEFLACDPGPGRQQWLTGRFGVEAGLLDGSLTSEREVSVDVWQKVWTDLVLKDLARRAAPFTKMTSLCEGWMSDEGKVSGMFVNLRNDKVFIATDKATVADLDLYRIADDADLEVTALDASEFEMVVVRYWGLIALPLLQSVADGSKHYASFVADRTKNAGMAPPIHTDERFFGKWADTLGALSREVGNPELLYVLAVGQGLISYETGRGFLRKRAGDSGGGSVDIFGQSLPKLLDNLSTNRDDRVDLASAVLETNEFRGRLLRAGDGSRSDAQAVLAVFRAAQNAHKAMKPVTKGDAYDVWDRIRDSIDVYEEDGLIKPRRNASMVPSDTDASGFSELLDDLKQMAEQV